MENQEQLVLFIVSGTLVLVLLVMSIILFVLLHQRKMHQNTLRIQTMKQAQEKELFQAVNSTEIRERERIAANLHDEINMNLHLIKLNFQRQKKMLKTGSPEHNIHRENADLLSKTIDGVTSSIFELVPKHMLQLGLSRSIEHDITQVQHSNNIQTSFSNHAQFEFEQHFNRDQLLNINRLTHEIINNTLKHSNCSSLSLEIHPAEYAVKLVFLHNGKPITTAEIDELVSISKGIGLKSMKARTLLLHGTLEYAIEASGLSTVSLFLPFSKVNTETLK